MHKILSIQIAVVLAATGLGFLYGDDSVAQAILYGGAIAWINTLLLAWRLHRCKRHPQPDANRDLRAGYASTIERFVMAAGFFTAGIYSLQLMALPLLIGFIVGQLALQISGILIEID